VDVTALDSDSEWAPYHRVDDVKKLEAMPVALRGGDLKAAAKLACIYELKPIGGE
jgi:hypothetical protein